MASQSWRGSKPISIPIPFIFLPSPVHVLDPFPVYLAVHSCLRCSRRSPHLTIVGLRKLGERKGGIPPATRFAVFFSHSHFLSFDYRILPYPISPSYTVRRNPLSRDVPPCHRSHIRHDISTIPLTALCCRLVLTADATTICGVLPESHP